MEAQATTTQQMRTVSFESADYFQQRMWTDYKYRKHFLDRLPIDVRTKILTMAKDLYYEELNKFHDLIISTGYYIDETWKLHKAAIYPGHQYTDYQLSYLLDRGLIREILCSSAEDIPSCITPELMKILEGVFKEVTALEGSHTMSIEIKATVPRWSDHQYEGQILYTQQLWIIREYSYYTPYTIRRSQRVTTSELTPSDWLTPHRWRDPDYHLFPAKRVLFENSKIKVISLFNIIQK